MGNLSYCEVEIRIHMGPINCYTLRGGVDKSIRNRPIQGYDLVLPKYHRYHIKFMIV